MQTCAFAEASPKPKNPRSERPHYFLKHFDPEPGLPGSATRNPLIVSSLTN